MARGAGNAPDPLLIVEGPTDVAAAVTLGFGAVGRPSVNGGKDELLSLLADFPADREILIVGEMDPKADGSWPGRDGAVKLAGVLASGLGRPVSWCLPPEGEGSAGLARQKQGRKGHGQTAGAVSGRRGNARGAWVAAGRTGAAGQRRSNEQQQGLQLIDSQTFATTDYKQEWLVKGVLVAGQPAVVGGPKKTLKTSLLIDLAVSLGTGSQVSGRVRRGAEEGGRDFRRERSGTLRETYLRVREARLGPCDTELFAG